MERIAEVVRSLQTLSHPQETDYLGGHRMLDLHADALSVASGAAGPIGQVDA
jgi:hypothetical protein